MSDSPIGDDFLKEGDYLSVQREVEMYAWEEDSETRTRKNIGGSDFSSRVNQALKLA